MANVVISGFGFDESAKLSDEMLDILWNLGFRSNEGIVTTVNNMIPVLGDCVVLHGFNPDSKALLEFQKAYALEVTPVFAADSFTSTLDGHHAPYASVYTTTMSMNKAIVDYMLDMGFEHDIERHLIENWLPKVKPHVEVVSARYADALIIEALINRKFPKIPIYRDLIGFTQHKE